MSNRREELLNVFKDIDEGKRTLVTQTVEEALFLEEQLQTLKKYPFIKIHPTNPNLQKTTAAGKQYKELLQQYNNCVKLLVSTLRKGEIEEDSPLRLYLKRLGE